MNAVSHYLQYLLLLGCVAVAARAAADDRIGGSLALTSDAVDHGISQDCGRPALQAGVHWRSGGGRSATEGLAGAWGSAGVGDSDCGRARELDLYAGVGVALGQDAHVALTYTHYDYPGGAWMLPRQGGRRYDYDALEAQWSYQNQLSISVAWTPDALGYGDYPYGASGAVRRDRSAVSYGLQLHRPLWDRLSLSEGAGYDTIVDPFGTGYGFWNAGFSYDWQFLSLETVYFHASPRARWLAGPAAGGRVAATLVWRF